MANEKDDEQFGKDPNKNFATDQQPPARQQGESSVQADTQQGGDTDTLSSEKESNSSQGTGGTPGSQSPGGTGGAQGGGFIGSRGTGSSDQLQDDSAAKSDFAPQSQGAQDNPDEDIETGQPRRDNDIEGGTGA